MRVVDCQQGTADWFEARLGKVTASEVCDAVRFLKRGENKGGESKTRESYKAAILSELLTGRPSDTFVSRYMKEGQETEPLARAAYEVKFDVDVRTVGFVIHPTIDRAGASPDGLIGKDGGLEIKCPKTETHIKYMFGAKLPPEYEPQVMFNLACTGREWWDFISFDPRLPAHLQMFHVRVPRNEQRIKELEDGVRQFLAEVDEMIARLNSMNPEPERFKKQLKESIGDMGLTDADLPAWWAQERREAQCAE